MSRTFTLKGNTHELSNTYYPPLHLREDSDYYLGLIGLHTYYTIPNVDESNNTFDFVYNGNNYSLTIAPGSYEITDIEKYLQQKLAEIFVGENYKQEFISLKPNNNTLKCVIKSIFKIDFTPKNTIGRILGFSSRKLSPGQIHESDIPVQIVKVTSIRVECNIIGGTYYNDKLSHTLFEFSPNVDPGFAINIEPRNIIYLPVNNRYIDNITIRLLDQNGKPVDFRGEEVIVRLELKKY